MPFTPQSSSYTGTQVVTEVRRTLGDLPGVLFGNEDALSWLNAGQREIAKDLALFGKATVDVVDGQADYVLPVELSARIRDIQALMFDGIRLEPRTFQQAQEQWMQRAGGGFPDPGAPRWWFQYNQTVTLVPTPDTSVTDGLTIWFARQPIDLTDLAHALEVPDSHYNALVNYVLYRAYVLTQETELANLALTEFRRGVDAQVTRERRAQTNTNWALEPDEDLY